MDGRLDGPDHETKASAGSGITAGSESLARGPPGGHQSGRLDGGAPWVRRGVGDELDGSAFGDEDSDASEQSLSTAELNQVLELEKLVEKGDW